MYQKIKQAVYKANLEVKEAGLVLFTWGNVSARDDKLKVIAIKPSGVPYESMKEDDIVIVDYDGKVIEGKLRPSVDLPTHLELYKRHPEINAIVHTHSTYATAWAQKGRSIRVYGTTHADYFADEIPCAGYLRPSQMDEYEKNTGILISETIKPGKANELPAAIVKGHGAFAWGKSVEDAVYHAIVLEQVAKLAYLTETLPGWSPQLPEHIKKTHYLRKHGPKATYGQKK
jgi:L-ribulose-5-phosphate 4-epimerase